MSKKIRLFNVERNYLEHTETVVNTFMYGKEVTKVFLSPGYSDGEGNMYDPIILVVYDDGGLG